MNKEEITLTTLITLEEALSRLPPIIYKKWVANCQKQNRSWDLKKELTFNNVTNHFLWSQTNESAGFWSGLRHIDISIIIPHPVKDLQCVISVASYYKRDLLFKNILSICENNGIVNIDLNNCEMTCLLY